MLANADGPRTLSVVEPGELKGGEPNAVDKRARANFREHRGLDLDRLELPAAPKRIRADASHSGTKRHDPERRQLKCPRANLGQCGASVKGGDSGAAERVLAKKREQI